LVHVMVSAGADTTTAGKFPTAGTVTNTGWVLTNHDSAALSPINYTVMASL